MTRKQQVSTRRTEGSQSARRAGRPLQDQRLAIPNTPIDSLAFVWNSLPFDFFVFVPTQKSTIINLVIV